MPKRKSILDWQVLTDEDRDAPWPPAPEGRERNASNSSQWSTRRIAEFGLALVILLAAGIGVVHARNEARNGIAEVEKGVQAAADAELWVQRHASEPRAETLVDDAASDYVRWMMHGEHHLIENGAQKEAKNYQLQFHDTWFAGRDAAAEVTLTAGDPDAGDPVVYHQTRFYRETPSGWLRTRPQPTLWGPVQSLETKHLIWQYRQRDHVVVAEVAEAMDTLYAKLTRDYGLTSSSPIEKLIVRVEVDQVPGYISLSKQPVREVIVPSPAVYLLPPEYSRADVLAQSVALVLLESMGVEAAAKYGAEQSRDLLAGLRLWEMWNSGLSLSKVSADVSSWAVGVARSHGSGNAEYRTNLLEEACTTFGIWMIRPYSFGIPVYCERGPMLYPTMLPLRLEIPQIGAASSAGGVYYAGVSRTAHANPLLLATLVDYTVETYGSESVHVMLSGQIAHESWETLASEGFGVSFTELERGWQEHLNRMTPEE